MTDGLAAVLEPFCVKQVPFEKARTRGPGETCAMQTLGRVLERRGAENLRLTVSTIMETKNNQRQLVAPIIWAISDMIEAHRAWVNSRWYDAFDEIELAEIHAQAKANRKAAQIRPAIATILFTRLRPLLSDQPQGRLL